MEKVRGSLPQTFTISGNLSPVQHYVRVTAVGPGGRSGSTLAGTTALPAKQPPQAPTSVRVSLVGSTSIGVSWKAPVSNGGDAITKYAVQWDTTEDFTSTSVLFGALYDLTNPVGGDTYTYVIQNPQGSLVTGASPVPWHGRGCMGPWVGTGPPLSVCSSVPQGQSGGVKGGGTGGGGCRMSWCWVP